jgi:hypothetical protein
MTNDSASSILALFSPIVHDAAHALRSLSSRRPYTPIRACWSEFRPLVAQGLMRTGPRVDLGDGYERREYRFTRAGRKALGDAARAATGRF